MKGGFGEAQFGGVIGVGEFRGDVVLGDGQIEGLLGSLGAVGFNLEGGEFGGEVLEESGELFLLKKRFATGDDEAISLVDLLLDKGEEFGWGEFEEVFAFEILCARPDASKGFLPSSK